MMSLHISFCGTNIRRMPLFSLTPELVRIHESSVPQVCVIKLIELQIENQNTLTVFVSTRVNLNLIAQT